MVIFQGSMKTAASALMFVSAALVIDCNSQAETNNPEQGSIEFGARKNPAPDIQKDMGQFATVFADVADQVVPSVVSVIPTRIDTVQFYRNPFYRFFDDEQGRDFFDFFFGPRGRRDGAEPETRRREQKGIGSGVVVSEQGYILTNYHVVEGASEIEVRLSDDRQFAADIVGTDSLSDVAVIKIRAPENLPVIYIGDSDSIRPGDWVLAVGNPFSLTSTVTAGIVSALGRRVMPAAASYQNFIQTDAAINPGNSGGALVNIRGELIGINTMIYSQTGGFMGIGFAIPINMARRVMEDIIYEGRVIRGWVGVSIQDIDQTARNAIGLPEGLDGVLVADVFQGQPADEAGIRRGDIILSVKGSDIRSVNSLRNIIAATRPGTTIPVTLYRDGEQIEKEITITEREPQKVARATESQQQPKSAARPDTLAARVGVKVAALTRELRNQYNIPANVSGVAVASVDPSLSDERRALQTGDVIRMVKVQGGAWVDIDSPRAYKRAMRAASAGDSIIMLVQRGETTQYISFELRNGELSMR